MSLIACGIAENEAPDGTEAATPSTETTPQANCPPDEMAEAVAAAIAATAGESGEPDPAAVRELSVLEPDLAGIECLENLERLYVSSPLPESELLRLIPLQNLHYLSLLGTTSLVPLAQLPQLTSLSVNSNDSEDLSPLSQLPALEELEFTGMQYLSGLSSLAELKSLRSLRLFDVHSAGGADDYSFLADLQLEELSLSYTTGIVDFANVDTSRLRSLVLLGTDATGLLEIGPPLGPPAEISLDPADFTADYPGIAAALCPLGWCVRLGGPSSALATVDPSCWDACE